jgi:transposase
MYSKDLCWRVVHLRFRYILADRSISQILNISSSTVNRTLSRFLRNGNVNHKKNGRPRRTTLHPHEQLLIIETFLDNPVTTLKELNLKIRNATGNCYVLSTLSRNIRRLGITRKKVRTVFLCQI